MTRAYFVGDPLNETDPLLASIEDARRRATLLARPETGPWRLDIRLQRGPTAKPKPVPRSSERRGRVSSAVPVPSLNATVDGVEFVEFALDEACGDNALRPRLSRTSRVPARGSIARRRSICFGKGGLIYC